jgi:hypothetical protein
MVTRAWHDADNAPAHRVAGGTLSCRVTSDVGTYNCGVLVSCVFCVFFRIVVLDRRTDYFHCTSPTNNESLFSEKILFFKPEQSLEKNSI